MNHSKSRLPPLALLCVTPAGAYLTTVACITKVKRRVERDKGLVVAFEPLQYARILDITLHKGLLKDLFLFCRIPGIPERMETLPTGRQAQTRP